MNDINVLIVIPHYRHETTLMTVVSDCRALGLDVLVVDDGSNEEASEQVLQQLEQKSLCQVLRRQNNGGKGAAVISGFIWANDQGYTHVVQVDADGQHDLNELMPLIARGKDAPEAIICGIPSYDESVPKHRFYARYLTHVWVWIETLSFKIKDSMCGFRLYPLASTMSLLGRRRLRRHMGFDLEILVRLKWAGVDIKNHPVKVNYPLDGVSHFNLWKDNVEISLLHTQLVCEMLLSFPRILWNKR